MNDHLTTELSRQLHAEADDWHGAPLTLESVQGKARSIRRRRAAAGAGVAAAAVMAVILPVALALNGSPDSQRPDVTSPPTEAVDPTPRADGTFPLEVLDAPVGAVPSTGFIAIADRLLHTPDGVQDLPSGTQQLEPFGDGWIGLRLGDFPGIPDEVPYQLVRMDADFTVTDEAAAFGLLVDEAGERAVWVEVDGDEWSMVVANPDQETQRTPVEPQTRPVGLLPDGSVALALMNYETGESVYSVAAPDGTLSTFGEGLLRLEASSEVTGAVSALASYDDPVGTACFTVLDPVRNSTVFETCNVRPIAFSPDGSLVAGYSAYSDGLGSPELVILDAATGEPVVRWSSGRNRQSPAAVQSVAWEDDDTLTATVTEGTQQTVVRAELDGTLERVAEPVDANMSIAYWLPGAQADLG